MADQGGHSRFTNCHPQKSPVFQADQGEWSYFYAPGMPLRLPKKEAAKVVRSFGEKFGKSGGDPWQLAAAALERAARQALDQYDSIFHSAFSPECLTVLISRACPMACSYCFAASKRTSDVILDDECFRRAARWVVENCQRKGKDFVLVIHGGGEPTVHMGKVKRFHSLAQSMAREHDVGFFSYIATSGLFSEEDAVWMSRHFSRIGLSCDGPPQYQDRQRPRTGGAATSAWVERSTRIINREGGRLSMRVTVTPASLDGLESTVRYGRETLGITEIRVEPVYRQSRRCFSPADAERFVEIFLRAQTLAQSLGGHFSLSGVRPREIHGAYCQIFRNVLQLNPDGTLSSCFLAMDKRDLRIIGHAQNRDGTVSLKRDIIASLSEKLAFISPRCRECVNRLHCARNCPDRCPLDKMENLGRRETDPASEGFRCRVQKRLTEHWIVENAVTWPRSPSGGQEG
jgi:radical SAM protein with 4Fe4S-binding SPASM domain